ncbi:MAG TPA: SDR family NAD(P)-dependent oxidoreductase, partial [Spongiibacteraceae bacterium]
MFNGSTLRDKVAYIAGGTSGINLGIAIGCAQQGAKVVVVGRDGAKAERAAAEIIAASGGEAIGLSADVRDYDAVENTLRAARDKFGAINIVIA